MLKIRNVLRCPNQWRGAGQAYSIRVRTENAYKSLAGKTDGKRQLRRPTNRWKDNTVTCPGFRD
jgi:hypothetical protein